MSTGITHDNIHLSEPILRTAQTPSAAVSNPPSPTSCFDPKILEFIAAATSANTRRAYQSDLAHFLAWGGSIPAAAEQVARYLADHAASLSMATLARRLVGIRAAHAARGFADPTESELVRLTLRGIRRTFGRPQRRVAALTINQLASIIASLGGSSKDIRDAALLLIGFAGAFRRSELVMIDCQDVHIHETSVAILVHRSKTDQIGQGRIVSIPRVCGRLCPVAALEEWLRISRINTEGPVFRRVAKSGKVGEGGFLLKPLPESSKGALEQLAAILAAIQGTRSEPALQPKLQSGAWQNGGLKRRPVISLTQCWKYTSGSSRQPNTKD